MPDAKQIGSRGVSLPTPTGRLHTRAVRCRARRRTVGDWHLASAAVSKAGGDGRGASCCGHSLRMRLGASWAGVAECQMNV